MQMRMFLFLESVFQHIFTIIVSIYQLCGFVSGLREAQAWSILDSVSWSIEQAVELALHIVQENENIPSPAHGLEISDGVFLIVVAVFILALLIFVVAFVSLTIFHVVERKIHQINDLRRTRINI